MPEPEEAPALTPPADQPEAQPAEAPTTETAAPFTRQDAEALIASVKDELKQGLKADLDSAYKAARRSESKGDTATAKIAKLETRLEDLATRGMDEHEARAWKAERALERAQETTSTVNTEQEREQAVRSFQERSSTYLSAEGIKSDDPRLTAAFAKYSAEAKSYDDWDKALLKAVVDIHKDEKTKTASEVKAQIEKAREEERARQRNEQRQSDGPVDKGQPSSTNKKIDWLTISDEEFARLEREKDAERMRRSRNNS